MKVGDRVLIPAVIQKLENEYGRVFVTCDSDEDLYVDANTVQSSTGGDALRPGLVGRIHYYLLNGGLWNPEMAAHDEVRKLLVDCRDYLQGSGDALRELVIKWRKFADADHSQGMKVSDSRKQGQHELLMAGQSLAYATAAKELEAALAPPLIRRRLRFPPVGMETACFTCEHRAGEHWLRAGGIQECGVKDCPCRKFAASKQEVVAPVGEALSKQEDFSEPAKEDLR